MAKRERSLWKSLSAFLLIFCLALGLAASFAPLSADAAAEKISDGDTSASYRTWLGDSRSTRYNGRVWTDKTVYTGDAFFGGDLGAETVTNDAEFLTAWSALATSQEVLGKQPADVVFILDFSASMTWGVDFTEVSAPDGSDSRIRYMTDALNSAIQTLAEANPGNRVGIVTFNKVGATLLPLTELSPENLERVKNGQYLELTSFSGTPGGDDGQAEVTCYIGEQDRTAATNSKTNIQYGLYQGMSLLAQEQATTVSFSDGSRVPRIPNVVLMSDGAPTTISSPAGGDAWWEGLDYNQGDSIGWGDNEQAWSANGFMPLLTAAYMKNAVTRNYYGEHPGNSAANVYTIGFSTDQQTAEMAELAALVLDPEADLAPAAGSSVSEIRKIYEAWQIYRQGQKPKVHYVTKSDRQPHELEVSIPGDAHNPRSLDYVTEYFPAASSEDLNAAFRQIAGRITAQAQVPTQVSGGDPVHGGYIAYTDPIGEYMEVKDVKTILFSGKRFDRLLDPVTETRADGGSVTTYRFEGQVNSPVYGQHSLSEIQITLETAVDPAGVKEQVLRVKIPASVIPLRVNTITLGGDGKVERNEDNGTYPIRVLYTVGLQPGIADDSGRLTDKVSGDYVSANRNEDGTVNFYSSRYSGSREGQREEASATFTPADTNPYYFVQQDTLLYADQDCVIPAVSLDPGAVYYFRTIYIEGTDIKEGVMERPGELLEGYTQIRDGQLYLKAGSPRLGYLRQSAAEKEENFTGTAESVCDPVFRGDPSDGFFEIYLGNNGRLSVSPYQASADREDGTPEVTASPAPGFSDDDAQSEEKPDTPPLTPSPGAEIPGEAADTGDRGSFLPYKAALTAAAAALAVLAAVRTVRKKQSGRF